VGAVAVAEFDRAAVLARPVGRQAQHDHLGRIAGPGFAAEARAAFFV
jgi:hypothetical protein